MTVTKVQPCRLVLVHYTCTHHGNGCLKLRKRYSRKLVAALGRGGTFQSTRQTNVAETHRLPIGVKGGDAPDEPIACRWPPQRPPFRAS